MIYKGWTVKVADDFDSYYVVPHENEKAAELYQILDHAQLMCKFANNTKFHPGLEERFWTDDFRLFVEIIKIRCEKGLIV